MTTKTKRITAAGVGLAVVAGGAFLLLTMRPAISDIPIVGDLIAAPTCPLSGIEPRREEVLERPAVAIKIENSPAAYPLAGLESAEIVYEELVEGGVTRFMAIYQCSDARKAGPVRSARAVDPAIMMPTTRILAYSGGNDVVTAILDEAGVVSVDENTAGDALRRVPRDGVSFEHTLFGDTRLVRRIGQKIYSEVPPDAFSFGEPAARGRKATRVVIGFSASTEVAYEWSGGKWLRFQDGSPFVAESGEQIAVDNVIIEEHEVNLSDVVDVVGTPSVEIADVTGKGRAFLFRGGRVIVGRWTRESAADPVTFLARNGDELTLAPGTTWVHLVPSDSGEVKGSFSFEK